MPLNCLLDVVPQSVAGIGNYYDGSRFSAIFLVFLSFWIGCELL